MAVTEAVAKAVASVPGNGSSRALNGSANGEIAAAHGNANLDTSSVKDAEEGSAGERGASSASLSPRLLPTPTRARMLAARQQQQQQNGDGAGGTGGGGDNASLRGCAEGKSGRVEGVLEFFCIPTRGIRQEMFCLPKSHHDESKTQPCVP